MPGEDAACAAGTVPGEEALATERTVMILSTRRREIARQEDCARAEMARATRTVPDEEAAHTARTMPVEKRRRA